MTLVRPGTRQCSRCTPSLTTLRRVKNENLPIPKRTRILQGLRQPTLPSARVREHTEANCKAERTTGTQTGTDSDTEAHVQTARHRQAHTDRRTEHTDSDTEAHV